MDFLILIIIVVFLIFFASFFSCTETAITSISETEKRKLSPEKDKLTLHLISARNNVVSSTLVGTNLINNLTTSLVTAYTIDNFKNPNATTISTIIITLLIILFAEILPKSFATFKALSIIKITTPILQFVRILFTPITVVLELISNFVLKLLSKLSKKKDYSITGEQLQVLVDISTEDGTLTQDEQNLLTGAIHLRDLKLRNIATPIFEMEYINSELKISEAVSKFCETKFSRLPVCVNDNTNNILGILHYKDILFNEAGDKKVDSIMRSAVYVPETASTFKVIDIMTKERTNIIIAIDDYGHNTGVATMDDIITAVFGTIKDEYDMSEEKEIVELDATHFRIKGDAYLYDINREFSLNNSLDINLQSDFYDTIAGLILETSEVLPNKGDIITVNNIDFKIEKIQNRKIESVIADITKILKMKKN